MAFTRVYCIRLVSRRKQSDSIKILSGWSEGIRERSAHGRKRKRFVLLKVVIVGVDNNVQHSEYVTA